MNEIKAFVGHSFTPEDAAVVQAFLNYFERLSKLHSVFSWEHAEGAEPRLLAEKVLSLVADKNTFIAICTRKEKVIRPEKLQRVFSLGDYFKGRNIDFEWKTSDWIIQEIGMAKGRGLSQECCQSARQIE